MSIVFKKTFARNGEILVLEVDQPAEYYKDKIILIPAFIKALKEISQRDRHREFLASRFALLLLLGRENYLALSKDDFGKPFVKSANFHISVSHSEKYIAVAKCDQPVGIDIQKIKDNILRIAPKFLIRGEIYPVSPENKLTKYHIMWGAKESIYKAYGRKSVSFAQDIRIPDFEYKPQPMRLTGVLQKMDLHIEYDIHAFVIENYVLVYASTL